jgi:hypothetical protein
LPPQRKDAGVIAVTLDPAVPAEIVIVTIEVFLAIGIVVLVVVAD